MANKKPAIMSKFLCVPRELNHFLIWLLYILTPTSNRANNNPDLCVVITSPIETKYQKYFLDNKKYNARNKNDIESPCLIPLDVDINIGHVWINIKYSKKNNQQYFP